MTHIVNYNEIEASKPHLILCDFDGTLTSRDSLFGFLFFSGKIRFCVLLPIVAIIALLYKISILSAQSAKEKIFALFFKGSKKECLFDLGKKYTQKILSPPYRNKFFRTGALHFLEEAKVRGARIIIVSASPDIWIMPFAEEFKSEYIATEFTYTNNRFNGYFSGKNCTKEEKVVRIHQQITNLSDYFIEAYGDSSGDLPMLALANKSYFKPFRA